MGRRSPWLGRWGWWPSRAVALAVWKPGGRSCSFGEPQGLGHSRVCPGRGSLTPRNCGGTQSKQGLLVYRGVCLTPEWTWGALTQPRQPQKMLELNVRQAETELGWGTRQAWAGGGAGG